MLSKCSSRSYCTTDLRSRDFAGTRLAVPGKVFRRAKCHAGRLNVQAVIPMLSGDATEQTPPDLPSFLFKERIVYLYVDCLIWTHPATLYRGQGDDSTKIKLCPVISPVHCHLERFISGMSLVPAVTELLLAELMYLQYDNPTKPIFLYINSAGVQRGAETLGYEFEALAIYDLMRYVKPPVSTLCVGNAFGEAAMLLAAGEKGKRAALPSATIMMRQPMSRVLQAQATDIDIRRNEVRKTKEEIIRILAKCTGQKADKLEKDISRPYYFNPYSAIEYGIIDKVLEPDSEAQRKILAAGSQGRR